MHEMLRCWKDKTTHSNGNRRVIPASGLSQMVTNTIAIQKCGAVLFLPAGHDIECLAEGQLSTLFEPKALDLITGDGVQSDHSFGNTLSAVSASISLCSGGLTPLV